MSMTDRNENFDGSGSWLYSTLRINVRLDMGAVLRDPPYLLAVTL